jgi:polar amino acid transport system substrate-binding protein
MFPRSTRKRAGLGLLALASVLTLSACGSDTTPPAGASGLDTLKPGVIKVAVQPYAPYTSVTAGKLTGLDSDILEAAAKKLGLKVEPQVTDFNGMLGGVQSHRVDMSIGGIAWSAERQKEGLFTDPAYYSPPAMAVHGSTKYSTVADLEGKKLGTVTGYVWVKSIKAIIDAKKKRPDLDFQTEYLTPPTAEEIKAAPALEYLAPYQVSFYVAKQEPKLEAAISKEIDKMYANGELEALIKKYGGDADQFLKPTPEMSSSRQGVDRPKDWAAPGSTS